jgi:hypothetical protein
MARLFEMHWGTANARWPWEITNAPADYSYARSTLTDQVGSAFFNELAAAGRRRI